MQKERDFPLGHPASSDFRPGSPEAIEWQRVNVHPRGERAFPVDHPKAMDTPGNLENTRIECGVDPANPHLEPFTGRTPEQAEAVRELSREASKDSKDSPAFAPLDANEANAVLAAKRKELGVETLTQEQAFDALRDAQMLKPA
jgi:hypothetical protein